jgi:predicted nucleotidyltransferase component of viral defense system
VSHEPGYATPIALRSAITDHLRILAAERPGRSLQDLLRQFAYDRLLYRVFSGPDSDRWVLKGATALLARLGGDARHTVDVDLYDRSGNLDEAELRSALSAHPEYRHRIRKRRWAENGA